MFKFLKKTKPKSLFGRTLLILLVPMILVQIVALYFFYERHWKNVTKHLENSLVNDISVIVAYADKAESKLDHIKVVKEISDLLDIVTYLYESPEAKSFEINDNEFEDFRNKLYSSTRRPLSVTKYAQDNRQIHIVIQLGEQNNIYNYLSILVSDKRLKSSTTYIVIMWMLGAGIVTALVASIFLKNQIRPIVKLARQADNFGRTQNIVRFKPEGAKEIRQAGQALQTMQSKIRGYIDDRSRILAGISHDLRTPLTRIKLQLSMLEKGNEIKDFKNEANKDIKEIEEMVDSYLNFMRSGSNEEKELENINVIVAEIARKYQDSKQDIELYMRQNIEAEVNTSSLSRLISNLLDNALKYGSKAKISLQKVEQQMQITVEDNGIGVSKEDIDKITAPFYRVDSSRNKNTGGKGLGLSIVHSIVDAHNGNLFFEKSRSLGGLKVKVQIPIKSS